MNCRGVYNSPPPPLGGGGRSQRPRGGEGKKIGKVKEKGKDKGGKKGELREGENEKKRVTTEEREGWGTGRVEGEEREVDR